MPVTSRLLALVNIGQPDVLLIHAELPIAPLPEFAYPVVTGVDPVPIWINRLSVPLVFTPFRINSMSVMPAGSEPKSNAVPLVVATDDV